MYFTARYIMNTTIDYTMHIDQYIFRITSFKTDLYRQMVRETKLVAPNNIHHYVTVTYNDNPITSWLGRRVIGQPAYALLVYDNITVHNNMDIQRDPHLLYKHMFSLYVEVQSEIFRGPKILFFTQPSHIKEGLCTSYDIFAQRMDYVTNVLGCCYWQHSHDLIAFKETNEKINLKHFAFVELGVGYDMWNPSTIHVTAPSVA